jgi:hypothetical protein
MTKSGQYITLKVILQGLLLTDIGLLHIAYRVVAYAAFYHFLTSFAARVESMRPRVGSVIFSEK